MHSTAQAGGRKTNGPIWCSTKNARTIRVFRRQRGDFRDSALVRIARHHQKVPKEKEAPVKIHVELS